MGRYDRQLLEFSDEEQERIRSATVGVVGCGGLGNGVVTALACAGIGKIIMMDPDVPDESNLNRQFVYCGQVMSGNPGHKAELLAKWASSLNPDVKAEGHVGRFGPDSEDVFDQCDVMVDCLDSSESRLLLNDCCVRKGKPMVHGAIDGFIGEIAVIRPGITPCFRCMVGEGPRGGHTPASLGSVVLSVASMEATEVLKLVTGRSGDTEGAFISYDFSTWNHTVIRFEKDPDCPVCGKGRDKKRNSPSLIIRIM